ncbi:MAG: glutamine--fructose-6-phosphate transaminase (isomerizing) [Aggregatilineales bacterium]
MCGIVGYIGSREAAPLILNGLQQLEYRGYDSAGIAVLNNSELHLWRDVGKLINLRQRLERQPVHGTIGIGHTRWATHGAPTEHNAHPHVSMDGRFVIVHNGIVENHLELRTELTAKGIRFQSETDSEVIAHLIALYAANGAAGDLTTAVRMAARQLKGAQAVVVLSKDQPNLLIAVRIGNAGGVTIGLGDGENFVASDIPAILDQTRRMIFLENQQMAIVQADGVKLETLSGAPITVQVQQIEWDFAAAAKGSYAHFMQKEIFEQPSSLMAAIRGRVDFGRARVELPELRLSAEQATRLERIIIAACGTSYYSGLIGKFYLERIARIPVEVDYGSEFRYRSPIVSSETALLAITQSGETVDTLAAMEEAQARGATLWSIVNALGSQAMRLADGYLLMNAGPEIGVASTKAFTASIVCQYLLALYLADLRGVLSSDCRHAYIQDLARLPDLAGRALELDSAVRELAERLHGVRDFLFLGRGINYPIALEGALKLKEISYIHAEGYPAGEMKHGPIALIDAQMPVLTIATRDSLYEKMISQIEQTRARGGIVIALATEGDNTIAAKADHVLYVPETPELLSPIVNVIPLQLLAYAMAVKRGADVDQPRHLAKSVTVE